MSANDSTAKKSIVTELNFGAKTSKRVSWESWEFAVEAPHLVRVTNASYGFEKADHSYLVGVEDRDGVLVPAECECPADKYNEEYDCKHKVALATVGGPVVLEAAVNFPTPSGNPERSNASTVADKLRADGGATTKRIGGESKPLDAEEHDECDCAELSDDFPCWPCVRDGNRELPE
ncbi:hypothetical protein C440_12224 [Haloferax mucosum ATCC BAA-1512]|uniref:SWIM-type domain-containing protein n=1 Tax=Haloferax mucosum ATCC BAA-1512 TaxID=662479 RepID=M0IBR7_9EURY|nr:SWIM zinc finger family protein [Haloferax mucosum]ELZ92884.1 hypothetical protein C440_12224 [Haloferax mucosum ATCC BAA-1512]